MPRRSRFSTAGYVFHVLNRAVARETIFHTEGDYNAFVSILGAAREKVPMRLLSYVVMPNHWHLVLWPQEDNALSEYMRWLSVTHAQRWHAAHGTAGTGSLYQGRFKSFPIQEDDHFLTVCRYVERNPLRANLVSRAELWKWSSLGAWRNEASVVSLASWPIARPTHWLEHVNEPQSEAELAALRRSVVRSRPFGDANWTQKTAKSLGLEQSLRVAGRSPG
jgi:Transposase and inactivated derivatives